MSTNSVIDITSSEQLNKILVGSDVLVIHFMSDGVQQCLQVNDVLSEMSKSKDYKNVIFGKVLATDMSDISVKFNVSSVPTCLCFVKGKEVSRINGADVQKLSTQIKQLAADSNGDNTTTSDNIEDRLKVLVNKSPVMVFMKGSPDAPRCGFSRTLISILNEVNIKYNTFDILMDEEVRQSLKVYSNWPTYPQIYVKGQLIGGLDIIKELKELGELEQTLNG
ncbi:glutaredoxin 3-like [Oppia nitens]|uniref:glutaredoxin 3-like n=1 Tax=Oppia nitens TaxID=1686743 RepID=UPI0023DC7801|nr:glutaredoxin 3-like [Oppia nitens]